MITAKVVGGAALSAKLKLLERAVQNKAIEQALVSGALVIVNQAKINAPYRTGTLRRSLHIGGHTKLTPEYQSKSEDQGQYGSVGMPPGTAVMIGTNLPYAARVEFGFTGQDSLGRTYDQAAQPYLTTAFEEKKDEAVKEIGDAFREIVGKLA
jgi:HK97 gp10 family phage protein